MANVRFDKNIFEKEIGKLTNELQEKIALFGVPVEEVTEDEIELEIFPNRPDLLSYQGFKRSFLNYLGKQKGVKKYKLEKPEKNFVVEIDKSLFEIRPYTACAIVKNLKLDDARIKEIIDLQEKIHNTLGRRRKKVAIGIYPLEEISLPIKFTALEPDKIKFVPLESEREMSGLQILQRHPTGRDYAHLLAGKSKFPVFLDAKKEVLSMPPIINSQKTGRVTEKTKEVFIECSGSDFNILKRCLNIIVTTLADQGGKVYQMDLKYSGKIGKQITPDFENEKIILSTKNVNKLLGLDLNEKEIKVLLEKMGHNYDVKSKEVQSPAWRTDLLHEVDIIEDVAIAYGYDKFDAAIPEVATIGKQAPKEEIKKKIAEILSGLNMLEVSNYHLTSNNDLIKKMGLNEKQEIKIISVEESKTDYSLLRKNLSHFLMKNFSENVDEEYPQRIFESGKVFELNIQGKIEETESFAIGIAPGNFTELRQILDYLALMFGIKFEIKEPKSSPAWFIDGRTVEIFLDEKSIGFLGEVHPKILKNWRMKMPLALMEICLEEIFEKLV